MGGVRCRNSIARPAEGPRWRATAHITLERAATDTGWWLATFALGARPEVARVAAEAGR
jgi:hypothetical protein